MGEAGTKTQLYTLLFRELLKLKSWRKERGMFYNKHWVYIETEEIVALIVYFIKKIIEGNQF